MLKKLTLILTLVITSLALPGAVFADTWNTTPSFTPSFGGWSSEVSMTNKGSDYSHGAVWGTSGCSYNSGSDMYVCRGTSDTLTADFSSIISTYDNYQANVYLEGAGSSGSSGSGTEWDIIVGSTTNNQAVACTVFSNGYTATGTGNGKTVVLKGGSKCGGGNGFNAHSSGASLSERMNEGRIGIQGRNYVGTWSGYTTSGDLSPISAVNNITMTGSLSGSNNLVVETSDDNFATVKDTDTYSVSGNSVVLSQTTAGKYLRYKFYSSSVNPMGTVTLNYQGLTNFTLEAEDLYGNPILDYNATVNGTLYSSNSTTGLLTTTIPWNSTTGVDVNISEDGYTEFGVSGIVPNTYNGLYTAVLTPVALVLNFDTNTSGHYSVNGHGHTFNSTGTLVVNASQLELGTQASVIFNTLQQFKYYYDEVQGLTRNITLQTPDLSVRTRARNLQVGGLENARVEAQLLVNGSWRTVYSELTDSNGYADILVEAGDMYRFMAYLDGYTEGYEIRNIASTSFDSTILIELDGSESINPTLYITSNCGYEVGELTYCDLEVTAPTDTSSITVFIEDSVGNNQSVTVNSTTMEIYNVEVSSGTGDVELNFYLDGSNDSARNVMITYDDVTTRTVQIVPPSQHMSDYPGAWFFAILILAGGLAVLVESKLSGMGLRVFGLTFLVFTAAGLWTAAIVAVPWLIIEGYRAFSRINYGGRS